MSYKKIVIGTDGSPTAAIALSEATKLAESTGAELVIVSSYLPPDVKELERWQSESPAELSWRFTGTSVVEEVLLTAERAVTHQSESVKKRTRFEEGDPAEVLIRVAEDEGADLLIVGNKGMTSAKRFLLGNVPNKVSHHAPCDLLIVRTTP